MTGSSCKGSKLNPLDSFFPFDPCLLRAVHMKIDDKYRPWYGVPGLDYDLDSVDTDEADCIDEADECIDDGRGGRERGRARGSESGSGLGSRTALNKTDGDDDDDDDDDDDADEMEGGVNPVITQ